MTNREFMMNVIAAAISDEMTAYAEEQVKKMDTKNETRRNTQSKTQAQNETIKNAVLEAMETDKVYVASEIAETMAISTQKASALLRQMVDAGKVEQTEVKVKNKGKVKGYKKV